MATVTQHSTSPQEKCMSHIPAANLLHIVHFCAVLISQLLLYINGQRHNNSQHTWNFEKVHSCIDLCSGGTENVDFHQQHVHCTYVYIYTAPT